MKLNPRPRRALLAAVVLSAGAAVGSCDDPAAPPPDLGPTVEASEAEAATAPAETAGAVAERPTTRELVEGPAKSVPLGVGPLAARVPASWTLESVRVDGREVRFLTGPTPSSGDVQIDANRRPDASGDDVEALIARAERRAAEPAPGTVGDDAAVAAAEVRDLGPARVLEERLIETPTLPPLAGEPETPADLRWTINVFDPEPTPSEAAGGQAGGTTYRWYTLNVLGVTPAEYRADEAFLRRLVDGVTYDAPAADAPQ